MFDQHHIYVEEKLRELGTTGRYNPPSESNLIFDVAQIIWIPVRFALKVVGLVLTRTGRFLLQVGQQQMVEGDQQPQTL